MKLKEIKSKHQLDQAVKLIKSRVLKREIPELSEPHPWSKYIGRDFECKECGAKIRLTVDTYDQNVFQGRVEKR